MSPDQIIIEYNKGKSLKELARNTGRSRTFIKSIILKSGGTIEYRSNGHRKFPLNHNYFEIIDSPKKSYFLGLMFADGFANKDGYISWINLVTSDRILLEEFSKEVFKSSAPVYDLKSKRSDNCKFQSRLIFKSREFQKNLIKNGLVHNKSLILEPPKNIPKDLVKYFILGYFDGDGCFSNPMLSIVSTKSFCEWIADFLLENKIISKFRIVGTKNKITHRLLIWRKADLSNFYNYFYMDNNHKIFLDRKREKIFEKLSKTASVKPKDIFKFSHNSGFSPILNTQKDRE